MKPLQENNVRLLAGAPVFNQMIEVLGYRGRARYVALYFSELGELIYNDGADEIGGVIDVKAWTRYISHPFIKGHLFPFASKSHALLIDRINHQLYAGFFSDVLTLLQKLSTQNNVTSFYSGIFSEEVINNAYGGEMSAEHIESFVSIIETPVSGNPDKTMKNWLDEIPKASR